MTEFSSATAFSQRWNTTHDQPKISEYRSSYAFMPGRSSGASLPIAKASELLPGCDRLSNLRASLNTSPAIDLKSSGSFPRSILAWRADSFAAMSTVVSALVTAPQRRASRKAIAAHRLNVVRQDPALVRLEAGRRRHRSSRPLHRQARPRGALRVATNRPLRRPDLRRGQ